MHQKYRMARGKLLFVLVWFPNPSLVFGEAVCASMYESVCVCGGLNNWRSVI